jgi:hypothetical protein
MQELHKAHSMEEAKLRIGKKVEVRIGFAETEEAKEAESPA